MGELKAVYTLHLSSTKALPEKDHISRHPSIMRPVDWTKLFPAFYSFRSLFMPGCALLLKEARPGLSLLPPACWREENFHDNAKAPDAASAKYRGHSRQMRLSIHPTAYCTPPNYKHGQDCTLALPTCPQILYLEGSFLQMVTESHRVTFWGISLQHGLPSSSGVSFCLKSPGIPVQTQAQAPLFQDKIIWHTILPACTQFLFLLCGKLYTLQVLKAVSPNTWRCFSVKLDLFTILFLSHSILTDRMEWRKLMIIGLNFSTWVPALLHSMDGGLSGFPVCVFTLWPRLSVISRFVFFKACPHTAPWGSKCFGRLKYLIVMPPILL